MGEPPIFSCQAQVFTIDPVTKKTWKPASLKPVDVNFFFDSSKKTYRIVSLEDLEGSKKLVLNCTVSEKMAFKQSSQKFGQWTDAKTGTVYGLGFKSENELRRFVEKFRSIVEDMRAIHNTGSSIIDKNQTQTKQEPVVITMPGPHVASSISPTTLRHQQPAINGNSLHFNAPPSAYSGGSTPGSSACTEDDAAFNNVQARIRGLETELANAKLQASKYHTSIETPPNSVPPSINSYRSNSSDLTASSGSSWPNVAPPMYNNCNSQSQQAGPPVVSPQNRMQHQPLDEPLDSFKMRQSNGFSNQKLDDTSFHRILSLQRRLGLILSEAADLNAELGRMLNSL